MSEPRMTAAPCPVCGFGVAAAFFEGDRLPLATLGWPASAAEAVAMTPLAHDFVQCPACSHVWNRSFRYADVPYADNANRMFNNGLIWRGHLAQSCELLVGRMPPAPTIVEIGCGEGHFLRALGEACGEGAKVLGFDPSTHAETGQGFEFHARLFDPLADMATYAPDAVVIRHVIEHLTDPAVFLEQIAWAASGLGKDVWLFVETPCIDRVFGGLRTADFFYEHFSHFTSGSFRTLMGRAGEVIQLQHGYDGEVIYAVVRLEVAAASRLQAARTEAFRVGAEASLRALRTQADELAATGLSVAIWGGTGKGAAFINQIGLNADRFPLVVDSDPTKVGTYVPGAGQEIQFRDVLKTNAADIILIPTQWRAADIIREMANEGIGADRVLVEHGGRLVDFATGDHPYRGR